MGLTVFIRAAGIVQRALSKSTSCHDAPNASLARQAVCMINSKQAFTGFERMPLMPCRAAGSFSKGIVSWLRVLCLIFGIKPATPSATFSGAYPLCVLYSSTSKSPCITWRAVGFLVFHIGSNSFSKSALVMEATGNLPSLA